MDGFEESADCGTIFYHNYRKGYFAKCSTIISKTQILHILGGRSAKMWTAVTTLVLSIFSQGRSKTGSAPRSRHCRMRPSFLLASPTWTWPWSLRSTHAIQFMAHGRADQPSQCVCFWHKKHFTEWQEANEWVRWMISVPLAEVALTAVHSSS